MKMDVFDYHRLYQETVERFENAFDELKITIEQIEHACMNSDEPYIQDLGSILYDAREKAEAEVSSAIEVGEVMMKLNRQK